MHSSAPDINSFERLQAASGLLITAEHWQRTQAYHRQRQNFYFQSLFHSGIVRGLGVAVIPAPAEVEARYRNERWIQVQPGVAIDAQGNPIIVPEAVTFQVQSTCTGGHSQVVYIVLNYVDPDQLRYPSTQHWVKETYRILEKTSLDEADVELCRIQLHPGAIALKNAENVLVPGFNCLDLNHRQPLRARAPATAEIVYLATDPEAKPEINLGLHYLTRAIPGLYPDLVCTSQSVSFPQLASTPLETSDLAYVSYSELPHLAPEQQTTLQRFVHSGGTLLIVADELDERQQQLGEIKRQLTLAVTEARDDPTVSSTETQAVEAEIAAITAELDQFMQTLRQSVVQFAVQLGVAIPAGEATLDATHPLRTEPFLFGRWPSVDGQPLQGFCWGGIVLLVGHLAALWGPDPSGERSRDTIRAAHELGINLLYYAWRRRHLLQLQAVAAPPPTAAPSTSLSDQVTP